MTNAPTPQFARGSATRRLLAGGGLALVLAVAGCAPSDDVAAQSPQRAEASAPAAASHAIDPVAQAFVDAWNNGDAAAMTSLFTGDAVLIDADRRFEGRDAIRSGFAEPEVAGYTIDILEVGERRADGQRLLVNVLRKSGGDFRATFDLTIDNGRIPTANLQYA